eukprot:PITA_31102
MNSIRIALSLATSFKWEVHQMDVKSTFLRGDLYEEIYMEQPTGVIQIDSSLVCQLKKSLYGLKQTPEAQYAKMDSFLLKICFSKCHSRNTVYTKKVGKSLIILFLYVGDLILTDSDPNLINHVNSSLERKFEMTDTGHLHYFLCLQVLQSKKGISLSQSSAKASPLLVGFTDFDWSGDPDDQKSTAGDVFTLLLGPITWACKKQNAIYLYLVEVEYRGVVQASKEAPRLRQILSKFDFQHQHPTTLLCDNQNAIELCKDLVQHQCKKHIEMHMKFIKKLIHDHVLEVQYCLTNYQVVDIFTMTFIEAKFNKL